MQRNPARILFFAVCFSLVWATPIMAEGLENTSAQDKAGFVLQVIKFVSWPQQVFEAINTPLKVGIIGDNDIKAAFSFINGKIVNGRRIILEQDARFEQLKRCQVIFIDGSENQNADEILTHYKGYPILTIGQSKKFTQAGGIIRLFVLNRRMRFEINLTAARTASLEISSKLLELAKIVN